MTTNLQIVLAAGACVGLAQAPIAMHMQSAANCSSHKKAPAPLPDKGVAGCHACSLPRPDDEDD